MIYIVIFIFTAGSFQIAAQKEGIIKKILIFLTIAIPVLFAALRNYTVGIDTGVYAWPLIQRATQLSWNNFIKYSSIDGIEIGYAGLTYVCANYIGGLPVLLGIAQLITIGFVFLRIWDFRKEAPVFVMSMMYMFLLYNRSFNLIRQCMAMTMVFYATRYIDNKKILFFAFVFVAMLFHNSAILGLVYMVIYYAATGKLGRTKASILIITTFILIASYNSLLFTIVKVVLGNAEKYLKYFQISASGHLSLYDIAFKAGAVIIILFMSASFWNSDILSDYSVAASGVVYKIEGKNISTRFILMALFDLLLYFLTFYNGDSYRFSLYFQIMMPVIIPQVRKRFKRENRFIIDTMVILASFLNWYVFMIIGDGYGTIPYSFLT